MTAIHVIHQRSVGTDQSLLQHSYFIVAAAIVFTLVVLRIIFLRRRSQALTDFFRLPGTSQSLYAQDGQNGSSYGPMYHGVQLAPLPAAYRPDRRVRAIDIDMFGRRLGAGEDVEGKDALPAYDNLDRPPKYVEASWSQGGPIQPTCPVVIESSEGEHIGMAHPSVHSRVIVDTTDPPIDDTNDHAVAGPAHVVEPATPTQTHHDTVDS